MGCTTARERIESKMLTLKLKRVCVLEQKKKYFKDFEKITGKKLYRKEVPDYIPLNEKKRLKYKDFKIKNENLFNEEENDLENNENNPEYDNNNENNSEKDFEFESLNNNNDNNNKENNENKSINKINKRGDKNNNKIKTKDFKINIEEYESIDNSINLNKKKHILINNNNNINENNEKKFYFSNENLQFKDENLSENEYK